MKSVLEMALREDPNTWRIICFEPVNRGAIQTASLVIPVNESAWTHEQIWLFFNLISDRFNTFVDI